MENNDRSLVHLDTSTLFSPNEEEAKQWVSTADTAIESPTLSAFFNEQLLYHFGKNVLSGHRESKDLENHSEAMGSDRSLFRCRIDLYEGTHGDGHARGGNSVAPGYDHPQNSQVWHSVQEDRVEEEERDTTGNGYKKGKCTFFLGPKICRHSWTLVHRVWTYIWAVSPAYF